MCLQARAVDDALSNSGFVPALHGDHLAHLETDGLLCWTATAVKKVDVMELCASSLPPSRDLALLAYLKLAPGSSPWRRVHHVLACDLHSPYHT